MHTQKEALTVLNCSKMTLSRYVRDGKIKRVKKGRRTYYDEHEVAALVQQIEDNQSKYRPELPKREKQRIELPKEAEEVCKNISSAENLTAVGYEYLSMVTEHLIDLGLYDKCDKQILVLYAISCQNYFKYTYLGNKENCIFKSDSGAVTLHPFFKVAQHFEKQMLNYMDRLGLHPLSRQKLEFEEKKELDEFEQFLLN